MGLFKTIGARIIQGHDSNSTHISCRRRLLVRIALRKIQRLDLDNIVNGVCAVDFLRFCLFAGQSLANHITMQLGDGRVNEDNWLYV